MCYFKPQVENKIIIHSIKCNKHITCQRDRKTPFLWLLGALNPPLFSSSWLKKSFLFSKFEVRNFELLSPSLLNKSRCRE